MSQPEVYTLLCDCADKWRDVALASGEDDNGLNKYIRMESFCLSLARLYVEFQSANFAD